MPKDLLSGIASAPQQGPRDLLAGITPQQPQQQEEGGFLSRLGNVAMQTVGAPISLARDVRDIYQQGVTPTESFPYFRLPESIGERSQQRSQAVRDFAPFAVAGPIGTLAGQGAAGLARRAGGAALGASVADVGQQVGETGTIDPRQAAIAGGLGAAGQGVGELVGAAIPAAARRVLRGGEQGRQGVEQAITDAARFGEVPTVAQATQSSFLDSVESILAKTPGSAGRIRDQVRRTTDNVRAGLERISQQGRHRVLDAEAAGQAVIGGVEDFVGRFQTRSGPLFERITQSVGANTPVSASNTLQLLQRMTTPVRGAERTSQRFTSPFIRSLAEDLAADAGTTGQIPFQALQRVRSIVGESLSNPGVGPADIPTAQMKRIYGAISDDIRAAASAAGQDASQAFSRANAFYRSGQRRIENTLEPLIKNRSPERVFQSLVTGARNGPTQIRHVYRSLTPDQQDVVTGAIIRRLGTATPGQQGAEGAEFSFSTFLTRWNQIDAKARDAIFARGRNVNLGQDINALARYAERVRESSKAFINPSGTSGATVGTVAGMIGAGSVVASPVLGTGALVFPLLLAGGAASANVAARMMTSPRVVRWLAQATRTRTNGIGAHIGRLSAIAAKEDPEVQEAISDYLDLLQSPQSTQSQQSAPQSPLPPQSASAPIRPTMLDPNVMSANRQALRAFQQR